MERREADYSFILQADLHISCIYTVYYEEATCRNQPAFAPRYTNGLILVSRGSMEYSFEDESFISQCGDVMMLPKGVPYCRVSRSEINSFYVIDFDIAHQDEKNLFPLPRKFTVPNFTETEKMFRSIFNIWNSKVLGSKLECKAKIYTLLYELLLSEYPSHSSPNQLKLINDAVTYIRLHYTESDLFIGTVAEALCISESQFRRIFQKLMHQTPVDYIRALRIEHAKDMLKYSSLSVSDIAVSCGFSSLYYFSRSFKNTTGQTPLEFRNSLFAGR